MDINRILTQLETTGFCIVNPKGNSMKGRISSGETVVLVKQTSYQVDDAVFCKVKGNYYIHIISKIGDKGFLIKNNKGHENGWTNAVYAKAFISA